MKTTVSRNRELPVPFLIFVQMESFTILPHTADTRLRVTGETAEQLFRSALEGLAHIQKKDFCDQQHGLYFRQDIVQIKSPDITVLLIDFLSEVLTLSHINKIVYCEVSFHKFWHTELIASLKGNKVNYFDEDVKAVTYHEAEVKKNQDNQFESLIIFDI